MSSRNFRRPPETLKQGTTSDGAQAPGPVVSPQGEALKVFLQQHQALHNPRSSKEPHLNKLVRGGARTRQ